jgi:DNA replication ATP-dependent helicase Dna2
MFSADALIEKILEFPAWEVREAGEQLLRCLSGGRVSVEEFLNDPPVLVGPPYFTPRYPAQVALRALKSEYESVDEVLCSLQSLVHRDPPVLEPKREASGRVLIPEAKVLDLRYPEKCEDGTWQASLDVLVTSGPHHDREMEIRIRSSESRTACFIVPQFWVHASIAAYNLVPVNDRQLTACPETFFVLEPMRQVNATSIARSLHCVKPNIDQLRRGKGDVTVQTLKGQLIHAIFDRMLEREMDLTNAYLAILPSFRVSLASITDEFFDEDAFRADVLRHAGALQQFLDRNPHLLENTQLELKRYSATIGIQGRIDALFRQDNRLHILELKTGKQIRPEDHAQLFIYRLLLSDLVRRWQRTDGHEVEITSRLLSSADGSFAPLRITTDFYQVLDARNRLIAARYALGRQPSHLRMRYEGFQAPICDNCSSWTRTRCKETSNVFGDRPDSPDRADLDYFRRLTRLVERERWQGDQDLADLLDDSRLDLRVKSFRTIRDATISPGDDPFTFRFDQNTSDLEKGDSVLIHSGRISSTVAYHGFVQEAGPQHVRVAIPLKNVTSDAFDGKQWTIDRFPTDVTAEASHTALYDFLLSPLDVRKRAILGDHVPCSPRAGIAELKGLNDSQIEAVERALGCEIFHLVWGPPGTGKTKIVPEIVQRVGKPILLGAFTNTAVDKMLLALLDADPASRFLRFGRSFDSPEIEERLQLLGLDPAEYFTENLAQKTDSVADLRKALERATVVAATAHRACTAPFLRTRSFEMAIVDEAGQLTEPLTLGLILRSRRFVLIGDDRQLPPVVRTRKLAHSMFERLKANVERSGSNSLTLLDTQYRMHPEIMSLSNRLFYHGRLRSGVRPEERMPPDALPVEFIPVETLSDQRTNVTEAHVVRDLVGLFTREYRVHPEQLGVVSPFRAQVVLLRQLLAKSGVAVDTVERFQGGERDIMIISFARSQGTGFVFDERRLNVAITRARRKLVLVAHPDLFRNSKYAWICTFTETLRTAGTI